MTGTLGWIAVAALLGAGAASPTPAVHAALAPTEESPLEQGKRLYNEGKAKYDMADFLGAIADWTEAYAILGSADVDPAILDTLVFNAARAQQEQFKIDGDLSRLRKAKVMLEKSLRLRQEIGGDVDENKASIEQIDARLAEAESAPADTAPAEPAQEADSEPEPEPEPLNSGAESDGGPHKGLLIGGAVGVAVGAGGLGLMGAGLAMGNSADDAVKDPMLSYDQRISEMDRGSTANTLAVVGGVVGGVGVIAGAALIALSVKKGREGTAAAPESRRMTWRLAPVVGRTLGASLGGSF